MEEQDDKRGFKVQDRRRFSAEGEAKEGGDDARRRAAKRSDIKSKPAAPAAGDRVQAASRRVATGGESLSRASRRPS